MTKADAKASLNESQSEQKAAELGWFEAKSFNLFIFLHCLTNAEWK